MKKRNLFRRLKDESGETLVETLISVLIISAVFLMLCTAIVTAANINARATSIDSTFNAEAAEPTDAGQHTLKIGVGTDSPVDGDEFTAYTQNGYIFYEHVKADDGTKDGVGDANN